MVEQILDPSTTSFRTHVIKTIRTLRDRYPNSNNWSITEKYFKLNCKDRDSLEKTPHWKLKINQKSNLIKHRRLQNL